MRFSLPLVLGAAALAVAFAAPAASDDSKASGKTPGFNDLDKNDDGAISRAEAKANPKLAAQFKKLDTDGDGKLSRLEYLKEMAKEDFDKLRGKTAEAKPAESSSSGGTSKPKSTSK